MKTSSMLLFAMALLSLKSRAELHVTVEWNKFDEPLLDNYIQNAKKEWDERFSKENSSNKYINSDIKDSIIRDIEKSHQNNKPLSAQLKLLALLAVCKEMSAEESVKSFHSITQEDNTIFVKKASLEGSKVIKDDNGNALEFRQLVSEGLNRKYPGCKAIVDEFLQDNLIQIKRINDALLVAFEAEERRRKEILLNSIK